MECHQTKKSYWKHDATNQRLRSEEATWNGQPTGKISLNLSSISQPLRELKKKTRSWMWGPSQEQALNQLKEELTKPTILALYDPQLDTKVSAGASSYGLSAVIICRNKNLENKSGNWFHMHRDHCQIWRESMHKLKKRHWLLPDHVRSFVIMCLFEIEIGHKPLVPMLNSKHLDSLPPRILRFHLKKGPIPVHNMSHSWEASVYYWCTFSCSSSILWWRSSATM